MSKSLKVMINLPKTNCFHYTSDPKSEFYKFRPFMDHPPPYFRKDHWRLAAEVNGPVKELYKPVRIRKVEDKIKIMKEYGNLTAIERYFKELNYSCSEECTIVWHLSSVKDMMMNQIDWKPEINQTEA
eukprot:NODE_827_length_3663_cov_1.497755.p4 type:complete len:128 gc:universal NODE_827_length_3663_cov_1.497755:3607-3224(-)